MGAPLSLTGVTEGVPKRDLQGFLMFNSIGAAGFEPTTPTTPKWCATKLRYAPNFTDFHYRQRGAALARLNPKVLPRRLTSHIGDGLTSHGGDALIRRLGQLVVFSPGGLSQLLAETRRDEFFLGVDDQ
jgi:hypothetical protein